MRPKALPRFPLRRDGKPLRPTTPIFEPGISRGSVAVGNTPPAYDPYDVVVVALGPQIYVPGDELNADSDTPYDTLLLAIGPTIYVIGDATESAADLPSYDEQTEALSPARYVPASSYS